MSEGRIFIDYFIADTCKNPNVIHICYKCGKCGRVFDEYGLMIDDGGTTIDKDEVAE